MITVNDILEMHRELEMPRTATGIAGLFIKLAQMGATIPDVAAAAEMTVERVKDVIAGKEDVTMAEHDRLQGIFSVFIWWNAYRMKQSWARIPEEVQKVHKQAQPYWEELCRPLKKDIDTAYAKIN